MPSRKKKIVSEWEEVREVAELSLFAFAKLVGPERVYGDLHKRAFDHLQYGDKPNSLLLLPRAHMKSHCVAVWCAWWITKHPETTILYLSATSSLAESQLYAIKNILTSDVYRLYWPEMIEEEEGKREKWSAGSIAVDHPIRRNEGIRDMTISAAGLTTNTTGFHADVIVPDDVVVPDNAYTEEGRRKVSAAMSQMASILNTGGIIKACGTRYHPSDQYSIWMQQTTPIYNEEGDIEGEESLWDILEAAVETNGKFIWPRAVRSDGKAFGFDRKELGRISAMYTDRTQFYAQYYNNPNDPESNRLNADSFQYYERGFIKQQSGNWYFKDNRLTVYAAIDFAYTLGNKSDYSAIVVIGIDADHRVYILDIDRFRTDRISGYHDRIMALHARWEFKKLRAEITAAQSIIVQDLKDKIRATGAFLTIDTVAPNRTQGSKEERIAAVLEPRYDDCLIYHYKGGYTPALEEELILARPPHDDLKDCLASVVETAIPPKTGKKRDKKTKRTYNSRFGGVNFRG